MQEQREGGFLIAKIHQITNRIFKKLLKKYGINELNPGQGRILFALWKQDGVPIHELSKKTQLTKSTLTTMLERLEHADFIKREPDKSDGRIINILLSEKSKNLQKKYVDVSKRMTELFYRTLTSEEIDKFEDFLRKILDNLLNAKI